MSYTQSFSVGGATYNAVMAPAVKQDELLSILTEGIMRRALAAAAAGEEMDEGILCPMFMGMPHQMKTQAAAILMHKVVIHGTQQFVTVDDFGGKVVNYNMLLAKLLRWNLADFFDWLPSVLAGDKQPASQAGAVA